MATPDHEDPGAAYGGAALARTSSDDSLGSHVDDYKTDRILSDDHLKQMDDERRDLPEGWVRCYDPKSKHHFYVEEATKRAIWHHPYDDPEFLKSLPESHPAQPHSSETQEARAHAEEEGKVWAEHQRQLNGGAETSAHEAEGNGEGEKKGWWSRHFGNTQEREAYRQEKARETAAVKERLQRKQEEFLKRQKELQAKDVGDATANNGHYHTDPYAHDPPPYSRTSSPSRTSATTTSPVGYGYDGGYGRRYGYGPYVDGFGGYGPGWGYGGFHRRRLGVIGLAEEAAMGGMRHGGGMVIDPYLYRRRRRGLLGGGLLGGLLMPDSYGTW